MVRCSTMRTRSAGGSASVSRQLRSETQMSLKDKTLFISGGSRGIGLEIALRAARDGANVALIAKTAEPHPKLDGHRLHGGRGDRGGRRPARCRSSATSATRRRSRRRSPQTVERFGGIDVCVNNASRDQPVGHRGAGDEALRPDAGHQHARHVRRQPRLHPAPASGRRTRTSSRCRRRSASSRAGSARTSATRSPSTA